MGGLTLREKRIYAGSLGGLQKALNNVADPARLTSMARDAFLREFGDGTHECDLGCRAAPFPSDLSPDARERGAQIARRLHFRRLVGRREDLRAEKTHNRRPRSPARGSSPSSARATR